MATSQIPMSRKGGWQGAGSTKRDGEKALLQMLVIARERIDLVSLMPYRRYLRDGDGMGFRVGSWRWSSWNVRVRLIVRWKNRSEDESGTGLAQIKTATAKPH
jgi:hypothetical protein